LNEENLKKHDVEVENTEEVGKDSKQSSEENTERKSLLQKEKKLPTPPSSPNPKEIIDERNKVEHASPSTFYISP
jgi:hypothetical protein